MSLCVYLMQPLNRSALLSDIGMTPALQHAPPANSTRFRFTRGRNAAVIFGVALLAFGSSLRARYFDDEYAYITQSYYADLVLAGRFNDRLWLEFEAIDLQPLPKYLIGMAFRIGNFRMPGPADSRDWYGDERQRLRMFRTFGSTHRLVAARLPIIPLGALGCLALFICGVIVKDARMGTIAAGLLILNPLYSLQSHRAMADAPYEAFMLSSLAVWLLTWARVWSAGSPLAALVLPVLAGILAGMSLLCKLNGFLGLAVISACCAGTWLLPGLSIARKLAITGATIVTVAVSLLVAVAFNPFLTAKPAKPLPRTVVAPLVPKNAWERFLFQVEFRLDISKHQKINFPNDALVSITDRAKVILVQGFGRFGLFGPREADSTIRYELRQDWGALLWLPFVCFGFFESIRLGLAQLRAGTPPAALVLVVWAVCAWAVVTLYLPMAWDRYQLPIQSGNALLAAVGVSALWDRLVAAARFQPHLARAT